MSELRHTEVVGGEELVEVGQSPWGDVAGGTDGVADIQGEVEPLCHHGHSKYDHLRPGCSRVTLRIAYTGVSFETILVESCLKNMLVSEDT